MPDSEHINAIAEDLIDVLQLQAKELEALIDHVQQVTPRLPEASKLSVVRSGLAALRVRIKKLRAAGGKEKP